MLKELLKQMQDLRERISKGVGYRCDIRVDIDDIGIRLIVFSKLNSREMHHFAYAFEYGEIADSVDGLLK